MPSSDDMAGETFGKYVVVRRLAMGGMAEVCLARLRGPAGFNKLVVVKQVLPHLAEDPSFVEMFLDEGRLAARLTHPNIAQTFELGEDQGRYFMAMEYVPGFTLADILRRLRRRDEPMPLHCTLRVSMQLLEALQYAHSLRDERGHTLGLVHRDVSPSNVMVTFDGSVKLLDFGIAKAITQSHRTEFGRVKGKGGYMSPEQCRGKELDARSDLYSAGAVLYQLVTGQRPFENLMEGSDIFALMQATMRGGVTAPRELAKDVPEALEKVVLTAMALQTQDRYSSAAHMLRDLEAVAAQSGTYPSAQRLTELMERLFPEKAPATSQDQTQTEADDDNSTREYRSSQTALDAASSPSLGPVSSSAIERPSSSSLEPLSVSLVSPLPSLLAPPLKGASALGTGATLSVSEPGPIPDLPSTTAAEQLPDTQVDRDAMPVRRGAFRRKISPWWFAVAAVASVSTGALLVMMAHAPPAQLPPEPAAPSVVKRAPVPVPAEVKPSSEPVSDPANAPPAPSSAAPVPLKPLAPEPRGAEPRGAEPRTAESRGPEPRAASVADRKTAPGAGKGRVQLDAYPWAHVSWKGRRLGETPVTADLPVGEQVVVFENPELKVRRSIRLTVKASGTTTHFEKLPSP